jgi:hypothetical protein
MQGELIAELKGNSMGIQVLDVAGTTEISISLSGNMRGTPVNEFATYVNRGGTKPADVFSGNGQGILTTGESEVATFTGESFGRVQPSGNIKWHAAILYQTTSTGKLAFLNNLVGISENQVDRKGNAIDKQREWK